jgi:MptA/FolE2 family GTP cyclohydrolase
MTVPEPIQLPDIQSAVDTRKLPIEAVGIKGLRLPLVVDSGTGPQATVAEATMTVALAPTVKGTHMSRFVEILEAQASPLTPASFQTLVADMLDRLGATGGRIDLRFPYFVKKRAPVSGVVSKMDYDVRWRGAFNGCDSYTFRMRVQVPVTSLCPCSREISVYGAHNQRSHIGIEAGFTAEMTIEELISIAEQAASCELYGLLKRPDEKFVTERAYDNPKFVEDLVRDIALVLKADARVRGFTVEAENFESIHNHSAIGRISYWPNARSPDADAG